MTNRTKKRWPAAVVLADYLRDYARPQEVAGNILYRRTVGKISRIRRGGAPSSAAHSPPPSDARTAPPGVRGQRWPARFELVVSTASADGQVRSGVAHCGVVVVATGLGVPNVPPQIHGIELSIGYEDLPPTGQPFEGKSVAVIGLGNAAFEAADTIGIYSNFVHLFAGRKHRRTANTFLSWESR
jgi:hypothetical protein